MTTTLHDIVMGPPAAGRECGGCAACCTALNVDEPELVKPAGDTCRHCTGSGCAIYQTRPQICRTWHCAWKRVTSLPEETRPDRMGVIFTLDRQGDPETLFDRLYFVGRALDDGRSLETVLARDVASMFAQGPLPIFLAWGESRVLVYPRAELAAAILDPALAADPSLAEEGRQWLETFLPFARVADESAREGGLGQAAKFIEPSGIIGVQHETPLAVAAPSPPARTS